MTQETVRVHHMTEVQSLTWEVMGRKLTDLQVAEQLFSRRIESANEGHLIAVITFADAPESYLFYSTSQGVRSLDLTDEEGAYQKAAFYEDLRRQYPNVTKLEQHLLAIDRREDFVAAVKPAIEASQGPYENSRHNTEYLFGILDQLVAK
ncbi:hypothetical protein HY382_01175 [Candidatus Curtissbacteria bacterium]|nr:hypothetical protein [Candidatus Curtissbacteria bacterium]